ncbi:transmembrane protein 44 isoform X5 [Dendropsophus ebraccatus]|uniref:transmembrane protein 44 isoform X5 n=1 Tax=Dendropsophus ebraccatus TaxID=150705 RepID=UPI003831928D
MDREGNLTAKRYHEPGLWNLDYLITCFAEEKICVSFGLWLLSSLFWFASFSLHFYLRCRHKSSYEGSVFWSIYGFFGSMCNTIGALLSKQLTIQIITGAYMALSDVTHFVLTLFPACNSSYRIRLRKQSSRRKYKPFMSALSLSMLLSLGYYYSLVENDLPSFEMPHASRRRLLGTMLQENTDVVGFTLGIIAVLVSWTVRVPTISKVNPSWTPLNVVPNRWINSKASLGRYVRLSVEKVQENDIGAVRLPGDGQTNPGHNNHKEPPCYLDLSVYPPPHITHYTSSPSGSSDASSNATDLEWDFEDLDQNWSKDSDLLSIQPNDSSVLKAISVSPEQRFPSTIKF